MVFSWIGLVGMRLKEDGRAVANGVVGMKQGSFAMYFLDKVVAPALGGPLFRRWCEDDNLHLRTE